MKYATKDYWIYTASLLCLQVILYFSFNQTLLLYALGITCISVLIPFSGIVIIKLWKNLTHLIGRINSAVILSIIYLFVLTPIALLQRMTGKNSLQLKSKNKESHFEKIDKPYTISDLNDMW